MPNVNAGHTYSFCKHYQTKKKSFLSVGRQFSCTQTNFHGQLKTTVNKEVAISPVIEVSFKNFLYDQIQNYLDKLKMIGWDSLDIAYKNE